MNLPAVNSKVFDNRGHITNEKTLILTKAKSPRGIYICTETRILMGNSDLLSDIGQVGLQVKPKPRE